MSVKESCNKYILEQVHFVFSIGSCRLVYSRDICICVCVVMNNANNYQYYYPMNKSLQEEMDRLLTPWQPKKYETMRNEFAMNGRDTEYCPDNKMTILHELERKKKVIAASSAPGKCHYLCKFCKKNGESERVYISHNLKDDNGIILCPILRNYTCPFCHASGDRAHTIKYCPSPRYYY